MKCFNKVTDKNNINDSNRYLNLTILHRYLMNKVLRMDITSIFDSERKDGLYINLSLLRSDILTNASRCLQYKNKAQLSAFLI